MSLKPYEWDEEAPQGVFLSGGDDGLLLLDMPAGAAKRGDLRASLIESAGPGVATYLSRIADALATHRATDAPVRFELDGLTPDERGLVLDLLGEGEVTGTAGVEPVYAVTETVLPGLWRVQGEATERRPATDWLEIADAPSVARAASRHFAAETLAAPERMPEGAMNAAPILAEIADLMREPPAPNHVLNFTLLPLTDVDAAVIARTLGRAPLTLASSGYGACSVKATAHRGVWAVQYANSMGETILDTIEVGDVPDSVRAADEDFEDSAARLRDMLEAYRP